MSLLDDLAYYTEVKAAVLREVSGLPLADVRRLLGELVADLDADTQSEARPVGVWLAPKKKKEA